MRASVARLRAEGRTAMTELEAGALLAEFGVPVCPSRLASSEAELEAALESIEPPWVLKILSPDIFHKTEVGGVILGVKTRAQAREAFQRVLARAAAARPAARILGVLVQRQIEDAVAEMLLGTFKDEQFGPVVLAGLGGIFAEALEDTALRLAPVERADALAMIRELRGVRLLTGFRGRPAGDLEAAAEAIVALSRLAAELEEDVLEVDVNPLLVLPAGRGAFAADALVRLVERGPRAEQTHSPQQPEGGVRCRC